MALAMAKRLVPTTDKKLIIITTINLTPIPCTYVIFYIPIFLYVNIAAMLPSKSSRDILSTVSRQTIIYAYPSHTGINN